MRIYFNLLVLGFALQVASVSAREPVTASKDELRLAAQAGGDVERGKKAFLAEANTCIKCHVVGGNRRSAGPDLQGIGDKYSRQQLIEHVLEPNAWLLADYASTIVLTKSGQMHNGILRKRNSLELQLLTADGELLRIPNEEIDVVKKNSISLMPNDIYKQLEPNEFRDLIFYLESLRLPKVDVELGTKFATDIPVLKEPIRLKPFHSESMKFDLPVWFMPVPETSNEFFVVEQRTDRIWRLVKSDNGDLKSLFLDLSDEVSEGKFEGLVCLALHPNFRNNGKYYLNHNTRGPKNEFGTVVVERQARPDLSRDSGKPTRHLLEIPQDTDVHPGGMIGFGPDGYLYVSTGDGGPQKDPDGRSQNLAILSGSLLRIDVDERKGSLPYGIPPDNPYVDHPDKTVRREAWAHGFRNLWRFSWDPLTKDMWIGDVGQNSYEEITIARIGENHGWNIYEGFHPHSEQYRDPKATYVPPVFSYPRNLGVSVTGGYVYRGGRSPSFYGVYIFADYESKRIWGLTQSNRRLLKIREIGRAEQRIVSFGEDNDGEIYAIGYEGTIYHVDLADAVFE